MKTILSWLCMAVLGTMPLAIHAQDASTGSNGAAEAAGSEDFVTIHFDHPDGAINYNALYDFRVPTFLAKVGGEEVCATIDTGASQILISPELAARLNLENVLSVDSVQTYAGTAAGYFTSPVEVEVPSQFRFEAAVVALPVPELICPNNLKLELFLGMPVFETMTIHLDHPKRKIAFLPGGYLPPLGTRNMKIAWVENTIDGVLEGQSVRMVLDTGTNAPLLVAETAWELYFKGKDIMPAEPLRAAGGVVTETVKIEDAELVIERVKMRLRAMRYPGAGLGEPVTLGYPFFSYYPTVFDASGEAIFLLANDAAE
jgi:hypothetical protein